MSTSMTFSPGYTCNLRGKASESELPNDWADPLASTGVSELLPPESSATIVSSVVSFLTRMLEAAEGAVLPLVVPGESLLQNPLKSEPHIVDAVLDSPSLLAVCQILARLAEAFDSSGKQPPCVPEDDEN